MSRRVPLDICGDVTKIGGSGGKAQLGDVGAVASPVTGGWSLSPAMSSSLRDMKSLKLGSLRIGIVFDDAFNGDFISSSADRLADLRSIATVSSEAIEGISRLLTLRNWKAVSISNCSKLGSGTGMSRGEGCGVASFWGGRAGSSFPCATCIEANDFSCWADGGGVSR